MGSEAEICLQEILKGGKEKVRIRQLEWLSRDTSVIEASAHAMDKH